MSRMIPAGIVRQVIQRSGDACEYCRVAMADTHFGGEVDHIISLKHGGMTVLENLAYSCQPCNRLKGSDLGSLPINANNLTRFYNPRTDKWSEHFAVAELAEVKPLTDVGAATVKILQLNNPERVAERLGLIELEKFQP